MFRVQRSPPPRINETSQQSMSDPNIPLSVEENMSTLNTITPRHKRPRSEHSPTDYLKEFKDEIKNMLILWKVEHDSFLEKIAKDIADLKAQYTNIQKSNKEIEKSIEFFNESYENLKTQVERLEAENIENKNYLLILDKKIAELQFFSRNANIEIRNIPQKDDETVQDLKTIVTKIGNLLGTNLQFNDIRDIYRTNTKPGSTKI